MLNKNCICHYCLKRKEGKCGLMRQTVKTCKLFSYFGEKASVTVSLATAKKIDGLINRDKGVAK